VNVTYAPKYAGPRHGAAVLSIPAETIATAYIYGTGQGPQLAFGPGIISTAAGNGSCAILDASVTVLAATPAQATSAEAGSNQGALLWIAPQPLHCDTYNYRIRKVDHRRRHRTLAGNGTYGTAATAAPATSAELAYPMRLRWMGPATSTSRTTGTIASAR